MVFVSNYERIQRRLLIEGSNGPFYAISVDPDTKVPTVDGDTVIAPVSVLAEEVSTDFGVPRRNRRTNRSERRSWRWAVICKFNQDVTAESAEKRLLARNILLPRDLANDLEQVSLKLLEADSFHPPQQNPSSGTSVKFTFEAELSPV